VHCNAREGSVGWLDVPHEIKAVAAVALPVQSFFSSEYSRCIMVTKFCKHVCHPFQAIIYFCNAPCLSTRHCEIRNLFESDNLATHRQVCSRNSSPLLGEFNFETTAATILAPLSLSFSLFLSLSLSLAITSYVSLFFV
jgi:hypothetical protein